MPRILLVNPYYYIPHPPLGLGYLSSYLKKYLETKPEVRLFDEARATGSLTDAVQEFKPDLVGISFVTSVFDRATELCRQIRTVSAAPIIAGGNHITAAPESIVGSGIDVGVVGEGEETFLEIVRNFLACGRAAGDHIRGIAFVRDGELVRTSPRPLVADLDAIPPPDRDLFDAAYYFRPGAVQHGLYAKGTSMIPSRGCPYHECDFCSSSLTWGKVVRSFSPRYVVDEAESIINQYNLNFIIFLDDNFTTSSEWLAEFCRIWRERGLHERVRFDCESTSGHLNDEKAALLKATGCVRVEFGFESGCPRVLAALKKGKASVRNNERAIEICHRHGIAVLGNMICGYLDETPAEFEESASWYRRQPIDYTAAHLYTPYPGTDGWRKCLERGIFGAGQAGWSQFQPQGSRGSLIVNREFPPGELERRLQALRREFGRRNQIIIFDQGLTAAGQRELHYRLAVNGEAPAFLRNCPWSRWVPVMAFDWLRYKVRGFLKRRAPHLHRILCAGKPKKAVGMR